MFEHIIKRLLEIKAPVTGHLKVPAAGSKAFEAILKSKGLDKGKQAIQIALQEFSEYNNRDEESFKAFKEIVQREFSELGGSRIIKAKAKALKEIWEAEARAIIGPTKKTKIVGIRLTEEEYESLLKQAKKERLDVSNYIRKKLGLNYEV